MTSQFNFTSLIESISSNFYQIDQNILLQLHRPIILSIISNDRLKLTNEDSLFDFICEIFNSEEQQQQEEESASIVSFLEKVMIEYLSTEKFRLLVKKVKSSEMTETLWQNLCHRFLTDEVPANSIRFAHASVLYDGNASHMFQGIIHKLTEECSGNVSDAGAVCVTSLTVNHSSCSPKYAVDLGNPKTMFFSKNVPDNWLKYDFKERRVHPTHYSIMSHNGQGTASHLRNWVIEGSNDDNQWTQLDTRSNDASLNSYGARNIFEMQNATGQCTFYRYLRIRQTGPNNSGHNYMGVSSLEYFGLII